MKKFLSVILCTIIFAINVVFVPYTTSVYAADIVGGVIKNIAYNDVVKFFQSLFSVGYNCFTGDHDGDGSNSPSSTTLDSIWGENSAINKWLQTKLFPFMDANRNIDLTKPDCPITYDKEKQLVNFNPTFTKELGEQVQSQIHALDGYYIIEPENRNAPSAIAEHYHFSGDSDAYKFIVNAYNSATLAYTANGNFYGSQYILYQDFYFYLCYENNRYRVDSYDPETGDSVLIKFGETDKGVDLSFDYHENPYFYKINFGPTLYYNSNKASDLTAMLSSIARYCWGRPFKLFYSKQALLNYMSKGRTYAPQLPSTTISIPIKYINNTTNLPDLSFNLDSLIGKAEADIQAGLDAQLKIYLDKLAEVNINPDKPKKPTPTPDGGFTDGTTPTPKPDFGDGSDLTDTNDWLKKIYEWLQSFGDTHSKFEKAITDYIEANDGKLDQIIEAINALSGGKTEAEKNGCKYDFTALSDFMTKLWNESDKKFDKMVELLEENNKYQKKLVNSLNEIKAILVTQTIMDVFQDRSQQTAERAKDKFPTSLPWDIALVVNAMSAEPEKPQFNLPIQIKSLNINEEIHVDLASGEWEKLAKTCRYLLSILFILLMIQLSRKLFSNGGDD